MLPRNLIFTPAEIISTDSYVVGQMLQGLKKTAIRKLSPPELVAQVEDRMTDLAEVTELFDVDALFPDVHW